MKIKGWDKIHGYTYKGYCMVNPIHNAGEDTYYATILDLNHVVSSKWDIILRTTKNSDIITLRIEDNITKHLLATSGLTKENIRTLQKFRVEYELLIDDILETAILSKVVRNVNGGTMGVINRVHNTGTAVTYSIAPQSSNVGLPKSGSLSHQSIQTQLVQSLKDLQKQIDEFNSK
jgi:hypothetical protein